MGGRSPCGRQTSPHILRQLGKLKIRRKNSDHGIWRAAQSELAADDRWVCTKAAAPKRIAENHHLMLSEMVFLFEERSPHPRMHAQHIEEVGGNYRARNQFRAPFAGETHRGIAIGADALKRRTALAPFHQLPELIGSGLAFRNCGDVSEIATSRSCAGKSSGRKSTPLTSEKMAVLAPMPTARLSAAIVANPRSFQSVLRHTANLAS